MKSASGNSTTMTDETNFPSYGTKRAQLSLYSATSPHGQPIMLFFLCSTHVSGTVLQILSSHVAHTYLGL